MWSDVAATHMWEAHHVTIEEADEAISDIDAVWFEPDPASRSGLSTRVVGYSHTRREVLCMILLRGDAGYEGVNGWPANATYRRIYREAQQDE